MLPESNGILISLLPVIASAEAGYIKGAVEYIRTHDSVANAAWAPPLFWFSLNGVDAAGSCAKWHGRVLFLMNDEQSYSMALAAYMGGKEVAVRYNDSKRGLGDFCIVESMTVGNPPPLF